MTPVENFRAILVGKTPEEVHALVGSPSCVSGRDRRVDVYRFSDGRSIHIIYYGDAAAWAFLFDPPNKGQELFFGKPVAT